MVAIPNHHFFQWVNQLKDSGYEVHWFDITDGGPKASKIEWVTQIKGWKLKWDFPFRNTIKSKYPKLYNGIQKINENNVGKAFQKVIKAFQPDIVHCFEMQLSGFPILSIMSHTNIPLIYSSWGSDMFYFKEKGIATIKVNTFLKRADYLITDCKRDHQIALKNGFVGTFLGVFPGNGGITVNTSNIKKYNDRKIILFKGYQFDVGEALQIVKAIELLDNTILTSYSFEVYSADKQVVDYIKKSKILSQANFKIHFREQHLENKLLLDIMGKSILHIANNVSDGMPNSLLEAMAMGAFPIQSNPGNATSEVITNNINGFLIDNPLDVKHIAMHIKRALINDQLRQHAQDFNINYIQQNYNRATLQPKIQTLYQNVYTEIK